MESKEKERRILKKESLQVARNQKSLKHFISYIKIEIEEKKDQLVNATGDKTFELQGLIKGLRRIVTEVENNRN